MALFMRGLGLVRGVARSISSPQMKLLPNLGFNCTMKESCTRSLWHLSNQKQTTLCSPISFTNPQVCRSSQVHTKGDRELEEFLNEEIETEIKSQKNPKLPVIEGFDVKADGSKVILTKNFKNEKITVKLNVNHTVDADVNEQPETPPQDKTESSEMKSKPSFTVEIEKGGKTIGFTCSFVEDYQVEEADDPEAFDDIFNIDEVVFHQGEWKENTYSVSGEIIDGYLYDLLMNTLEARGISTEFAEKLSEYCTSYEHKLYISLLENLKAFVKAE